ncbi:hypothetical protein K490DRAFT_57200 [Saccharata proteae CBS 121410]|uniref:Uncharacterized protein n=1 Tax=Saccharata proteae CBS 121410 TaxID=1314787 RepID=A0A9P4HSE5_9PEZI|nr:hypothetical protein K490DRAFT_57200 [Saccharata proteae CBS 121410]
MASQSMTLAPLAPPLHTPDDSAIPFNESTSSLHPPVLNQPNTSDVQDLQPRQVSSKITMPNCRKKVIRFEYLKDSVNIRTPCFETSCLTCGPEVERLARSLGTWRQTRAAERAALRANATESMKRKAREDVEQRVGWVKNIYARNAPAVKPQKNKQKQKLYRAVVGGEVEDRRGPPKLEVMSRGRRDAYSATVEKREHRKLVRLAFKDKKEEYRRLVERSEGRRAETLVVKLGFERRREEFEELIKSYEHIDSDGDRDLNEGEAEHTQQAIRAGRVAAGERVGESQQRKTPKLFLRLSKGQITPRWEGTSTTQMTCI